MTRIEVMEQYLKPFIYDHIKKKFKSIDPITYNSVPKEIQNVLWSAVKKQKTDGWVPAHLAVFHLNSSLLTRTYCYQIRLMDEKVYFDDQFEESYWLPSFMYGAIDEEKTVLSQVLKSKFARVKEYEINHGLRQLVREYKKVMEVYLIKMLYYLNENSAFIELEKKEPFHFLFGDYMGEIKSILIYEGGNIHVN